MKKLRYIILIYLSISSIAAQAQTTEFEGYFLLHDYHKVVKVVTVPDCPQTYIGPTGVAPTVTTTKKYTNNKSEIVIEHEQNPAAGTLTINADKELRTPIYPDARGMCNLYVDDKDKSVLYVNYGLAKKHVLPSGAFVILNTVVYDCSGTPSFRPDSTHPRATTTKENIYSEWVGGTDTVKQSKKWFINSDNIAVYASAGGGPVLYYLVRRYDGNTKYVLQLQNREYVSYYVRSLDFGALTIPFKYRFGFKKNNIEIYDDITASFNVGLYAGYKVTKSSIINKAGTYKQRNHMSFRIGPFVNVSAVTIDSIASTVGKVPFKGTDKRNIAVLSGGLGFMADFKGVQVGLYTGVDFGVGPDAANWNYHKKFWLGFGVGYKLTDLFAKKE